MTVTSPAFAAGQPIPPRYTCEAGDLSPPLQWSQGPTGTKRYVIVMEDLDSKDGVWDHWVIWNLRGTSLPEGQSPSPLLPGAVCQGVNSWGQTGYRGPCPPIGEPPHRYRITVFAVNQPLGAPFDSTRNEVVQLIQPFVLSKGELEFTCQRKSGQ
jgi:Raf kinase inhibitor-like YbhB/YbcL family protein